MHTPWNYAELEEHLLTQRSSNQLESLNGAQAFIAYQCLENTELTRQELTEAIDKLRSNDEIVNFSLMLGHTTAITNLLDALLINTSGLLALNIMQEKVPNFLHRLVQSQIFTIFDRLSRENILPENLGFIFEHYPNVQNTVDQSNLGILLFSPWDMDLPPHHFLETTFNYWNPWPQTLIIRNVLGESVLSRINNRCNDLAIGLNDETLQAELHACAKTVSHKVSDPLMLVRELPALKNIIQDETLLNILESSHEANELSKLLNEQKLDQTPGPAKEDINEPTPPQEKVRRI